MTQSEELTLHSLKSISSIDGRHRIITEPLSEWLSEYALHKYRFYLEVEYLIALSEWKEFKAAREMTLEEKEFLRNLVTNFTLEDANIVQNLDRFGYKDQKPTNHDVKAVEYFFRLKLKGTSLEDLSEIIHFGLTSEDANNIAYNCMIRGALKYYYFPALISLLDQLKALAEIEKNTPMLSRTHGQPATPTTFGKEMANYLDRIRKVFESLYEYKLPAKLNGAVGCHNAQYFAEPNLDWITFTEDFLKQLGFMPNLLTTQIEPHDGFTEIFSKMISINNILRDMSIDYWLYIMQNYIVQKKVSNEIGSSTMPHKINPWRMEVAEGSTIEANSRFTGFIWKLQTSRLQRDLSDHEAQRSIGTAIAHSYIAILHVLEELGRLEINRECMKKDLEDNGVILTEAIQTILRKDGYPNSYELMKDLSRGQYLTVQEVYKMVNDLTIKEETKNYIKTLKPETYLGLAVKLTEVAIGNWISFKDNYNAPYPQIKKIIIDCECLEISEKESLILNKIKEGKIELLGLNTNKSLFSAMISSEKLNDFSTKSNLFIGKSNANYLLAKQKGLLCVPFNSSQEKAEFKITTFEELPSLIKTIQES